MKQTREQYAERLRYRLRDVEEALVAAVSIRDWRGVVKYAEQAMELEPRLYDVEAGVGRRSREMYRAARLPGKTAGEVFGRGGRWRR